MNSKKKETRGTKATRGTKVTKATRETKVLCPGCGTEFAIAKNEFTTVATVKKRLHLPSYLKKRTNASRRYAMQVWM